MHPLVSSITEQELRFISELDYGNDADKHYDALVSLLSIRSCRFEPDDVWFPYEVIELGSHGLQPGHEREFAICTLLVIHGVASGFDKSTTLDEKLSQRAKDYEELPGELRDIVHQGFSGAIAQGL